jgi:hypothetical protein
MAHVTYGGSDPAAVRRFNENALRAALAEGASPEFAAARLMAALILAGDYDGVPFKRAQLAFEQILVLAYGIAIDDIAESEEPLECLVGFGASLRESEHGGKRLPGQVHDCETARMIPLHHATAPVHRTMTVLSLGRRPGQ